LFHIFHKISGVFRQGARYQLCAVTIAAVLASPADSGADITVDSTLITVDSTLVTVDSTGITANSGVQYMGVQTSPSGKNLTAFSVHYDQLGLVTGDIAVVSVTTDYAHSDSLIIQDTGHPGGTTVYNADDNTFGQPRLRVDVIVYDGTWPATLDYTFSVPDNETWIAYVTRWSGADTNNPVAVAEGSYDGVTATPTAPALLSPENNLTALTIYGAREDDFDSNGTPNGYTTIGIGASNTGTTGSSSGIAYRDAISSGVVPATTWTQAAATQAHAAHLLLRGAGGNNDLDGDGLANSLERIIGTNELLSDTDGDGLDDFTEVAYDGDPTTYTQGLDTDPLSADTDADGITDPNDPIPLDFNFADGDLAPSGTPDSIINVADLLIAQQIVLGLLAPTSQELAHGDLYPPGAPDGLINIQDLILLQQLVFQQN
jgi:hypothetical protein